MDISPMHKRILFTISSKDSLEELGGLYVLISTNWGLDRLTISTSHMSLENDRRVENWIYDLWCRNKHHHQSRQSICSTYDVALHLNFGVKYIVIQESFTYGYKKGRLVWEII